MGGAPLLTSSAVPTPPWILLLSAVGMLLVLRFTFSFVAAIYRHFLRQPKDLVRSYGAWALVTGPTDGIGRALAFRLARCGLNLLLVARCPSKLDATSRDIRSAFPVEVRTLVMDFATEEFSLGVRRLREAIEGLDVGVVVNNAGTTYPAAMYFDEVQEPLWRAILGVNLVGVTVVTRAVVPAMVKRGRGAVICVGSGSAFALPSFPLSDIYAATKAYVDQLCRSLYVEYRDLGIDVQCQIPMYVATKMVGHRNSSFFTPTPDAFACSAVRWIGYERRCLPHWTHALQCWFVSSLPDSILNAARLHHAMKERRTLKDKFVHGVVKN